MKLELFFFSLGVHTDVEEGGIRAAGDGGSSGNVRNDLSDWQEGHAVLILSKVKVFYLFPLCFKTTYKWNIFANLLAGLQA